MEITVIKQIRKPIVPVMSNPDLTSTQVTEGIYGEKIKIIEKFQNFSKVVLKNDHYVGWIENEAVGQAQYTKHKIVVLSTSIKKRPDLKSASISWLPFGANVEVTRTMDNWVEIKFDKLKGYISNLHTSRLNKKSNDWVKFAELFIHSPYKWGGKSLLGIDCSGLVQLAALQAGIKIPRDTIDQIKAIGFAKNEIQGLVRGDLIFWEGHVGIIQNSNYILHANAHHMKVTSEKIDVVFSRHKKIIGKILKIRHLKVN